MGRRPTNRQQQAQIDAILAQFEPQIQAAFLEAIQRLASAADLAAFIAAFEARDIEGAIRALRIDDRAFWPLQEAIRGAFTAGGVAAGAGATVGLTGAFGFNGRHLRAEALIAEHGAALVRGITDDAIQTARQIITEALEAGVPSRTVARQIVGPVNRITGKREGGLIGLDGPRAARLRIVTDGMKTPEGVADLVVMRDGVPTVRYKVNDATAKRILRAYARGEAVSPADQAISERQYRNKLLKERGETIARNEAHSAQAMGRDEAYRQMLEDPEIETVTKKWVHGHSKDPRHDHKAMDGTVIGFNEEFVMADGTRMRHPHDPRGGAKHSIGCRCSIFYRAVPRRD
jgi:hypothetical protein